MTGDGAGRAGPRPRPKSKASGGARRRRKKGRQVAAGPTPVERRPGGRAGLSAVRWALAVFALLALGASGWLFVAYPSERGPGDGRASEVFVVSGSTPGVLAATLEAAGVLRHPRLFALWVRVTGGTGGVVVGRHLLTDDATPRELMARLERRSAGATQRVTFPEGWTRFDMARRLQDKHIVPLREFLDASTDPALLRELGIEGDSAEGFLFPATYDLPFDSDPRDVVRRMKREFDRRWDLLSRAHGSSLNDVLISAHLGVYDVVTLASMVEKEAALDDERPIIASVFLNRLRDPAFKPKHLECDPTASYGCLAFPERAGSCSEFTGRATAAIEHDPDNPYSTYTHEGLPPGPIGSPGARSLEAVMSPAMSRYLFFVARGEGRHTFSETYEAHLGAVRGAGAAKRTLAASAEAHERE